MHLRTEQRLRRQDDFRRVRAEGRRIDGGGFTLWWRQRDADARAAPPLVRVGVVASIAAVGPAVRRNAAKRRLRELFRRHQDLVPPGTDLLLVARSALNRLAFQDAEEKFIAACRRITGDPA
jgi:ribonuclease P protein component